MPSPPDSNVCPDERFYFSDGSLYLLAENSLYCLHRFVFEIHASTFPILDLVETSSTKPYVLRNVKKIDFDRLLASIYPRTLWVEEAETTEDWISILELASKWGFKSLRSRAISKIGKTLDSPIDMVILGHQYDIHDVLLAGYVVLCQSAVPLSYEEGLRLGVEDLINIYRIRHELYYSGITLVPFDVAFAKVKEAGLGAEQHRPRPECNGERSSVCTDIASVVASQASPSEAEERGTVSLTPTIDSPSWEEATNPEMLEVQEASLVPKRFQRRHCRASAHPPNDGTILNNGSNYVLSSMFPNNVPTLNSGPSRSTGGFKLLTELTMENFDQVSSEIIQWVNTKDVQTLHQITRLIVERAMEESHPSNACARLCSKMVKETNHKFKEKVPKNSKLKVATGGSLFREYLGEICRENLEGVTTSIVAAGGDEWTINLFEVRRVRLIEFIRQLSALSSVYGTSVGIPQVVVSKFIISKWVTSLLETRNDEKLVTLCMLLTSAGPLWETYGNKHVKRMNTWFQTLSEIAQTTNPRVQAAILEVTKLRERGWVATKPRTTWG